MLQSLTDDARLALRSVSRAPGLHLLVASILALGIAASVTTLTLADAVLLRPLPFPDSDRLTTVFEQNLQADITQMLLSHPSFEDLQQARSFDRVAGYQSSFSLTLAGTGGSSSGGSSSGGSEAIRVRTNFVSQHYFSLLGIEARYGRLFVAEEHGAPMAHRVAVISDALWQNRFGGDPAVLGRRLELNDQPFVVVGVVAPGFDDLPAAGNPTEVWLPLETYPVTGYDWPLIERRTTRFLGVLARLAPGAGVAQARAEMQSLAERLEEEHPAAHGGYSLVVERLGDFQAADYKDAIVALLGGAFFVLLIGCANAANLLLVRATKRRSEMALHLALGAEIGRLWRRLFFEGLLTSLGAAALGVPLGFAAIKVLLRFSPVTLPDYVVLEPSPLVLAVATGLAIATGLLFGLVPGLMARSQNLRDSLLSESPRSAGRHGETWRQALIVVEVASAVTLLVGGLLMAQSFRNLSGTDIGFDTERLLTLRTSLPTARYDSDDRLRVFARSLRESLAAQPGVEEAIIWAPTMPSQSSWYRAFAPGGRSITSMSEALAARYHLVSPGAVEALGVPLISGRTIDSGDRAGSRPVVVVSESASRTLWGADDPIGRTLFRWRSTDSVNDEQHYTVVGVVADVRQAGRALTEVPLADVYFSFDQQPSQEINVLVRTFADPGALAGGVREAVRAVDPQLPLFDLRTMEDRLGDETRQSRFTAFLSGAFAIVSSLLAGLGLYSVLAYFAQTHSREIGLRMALGGRRIDIVAWMSARTGRVVAVGLALGLGASLLLTRQLESSLFGVDAQSPATLLLVVAAMTLVAGAAALIPLIRASRVEPAIALRAE